MKSKRWFRLAAVAVFLVFMTACGLNNQDPQQLHSAAAADILTSDQYCFRYTSKWIFSDERPVEFLEIKDGSLRLQKYDDPDGNPIVTLTENGVSKVFLNGEFLQEIQEPEPSGELSLEMRYNGKTGAVTLEETSLSFEEYSCTYNKSSFTLRFLFSNDGLWGIQYDDDGRYIRILELTGTIPEGYQELYSLG